MFGVSATAFSFKQIFKGLRSNTGTGHLGLFKKHAARTPFGANSMQTRSRAYSIRADENRLAGRFTFASRYCFSTGHAGGKSKDSLMLILRPNENLEAAREYETLRTFFVSKEAFVPSLDDLRTGLRYLACFGDDGDWETVMGSALECRQFAFDALVKSMEDKDSEQSFAIMKEEARQLFFYIDTAIPRDHLQRLLPTSTVVDCNASTLPVLHQPAETKKRVGEYKGSLICTRKLSATDLQRLADFIGSLSPVSRSFRFSSRIPFFDIATAIVATALKGSASYIPLVDDNGEIKGLGDIVPRDSGMLKDFYGAQGLVAIHDVKTFEINIVIADSFQGCGLGTELYRLTIGEAENSGYKQVYARVNAANRRAITFCESVGMKKLSETADVVHYLRLLH